MLFTVLALHCYPNVVAHISGLFSDFRFYFFEISDKISKYFVDLEYNFSKDIGEKIFDLRCENIKLKLQVNRMHWLIEENKKLKSLLKMKETTETEVIFAKVINVYNNDFARSALINGGKKQNIQLDNFAYDDHGIIGRVIEVSDNWSKVLFIVDTNSHIPAKISGINVMLSGDNSNLLKINLLNEEIKPGDIVESSSYGKVFQENIMIGRVIKKNDEFFVEPAVNFNNLKYICIGKCQD